jgi:hypothetical protein
MMKYLVFALVLILAASAFGLEKRAYQMKEDFGTELQYDGALQYYYYIPAPTYSWFWAFTGWAPGDIIGMGFHIGDQGTGGHDMMDPMLCQTIAGVRILDFAGYGIYYPGLFTVEIDVWCAGPYPCWPDGPQIHVWGSGPYETAFGWNYIYTDPVCLTECWSECAGGAYPAGPQILVTLRMTGTQGVYPAVGFDNISTPLGLGYVMHDIGCLPAFWPRMILEPGQCPCNNAHGGYFGSYFWEILPPESFIDGRDTTPDGSQYGAIEMAWRILIICGGPTSAEPSTWSNIKSMYRQ